LHVIIEHLSRVDHDKKIRSIKQKTDIEKYSFLNRAIQPWNNYLQMLCGLSPVDQVILRKGLGE
jgi:hypothetical protein